MAISSLSDIQGQYGIGNSASTTAIEDANKSIFENVKNLLAQTRSNSLESLTSRGLGRSSFGEGYMAKQETDVMNSAIQMIANNNLTNANADSSMFRDIFKMQNESKLKTEQAGDQLDRLSNTQSRLQLEQFIPNLLLKQADAFGSGKPAPLYDWAINLFSNMGKNAGIDTGQAPTASGLVDIGKSIWGDNWMSNLLSSGNSVG